ncbi:BTAD domain-containing putative transcriptional regulator [Streptomyces luomodiensis]|uniref:BTAD domain-containing putative transcriptional regulator n=1 Tax=Streptomyces luomodiensis TaxID=3026192 RepID=A0ABY9V9R3_9ACTN|nr:BTAD domain-containing putative transcriptional regulator [Streptomyces sp. SCA4-21]WNF01647.1 BTAD domain-containing putative transcriptional regulator [Streptomyces sp. SCA4-21]
MRYLILGTTEARDDHGNPLPLGGPRIRALLAALAVRAARPAPATVDVLIDEVWADDPPHDAPAALQALVGRLRRAIGRSAVISSLGGYRLATTVPQDDVDLLRFERLTNEGLRALQAGDPETAAATLRKALALWRGPALADLPDRDAAAARPEALRLTALHRRIDADLALDRPTDVIPELRELVADHPLDETFHAQLIRALRAAGHSADALAAYEDVRRTLAERLGADPGAELRELHRRLLTTAAEPALREPIAARGDPSTAADAAPRADGHGATGTGSGSGSGRESGSTGGGRTGARAGIRTDGHVGDPADGVAERRVDGRAMDGAEERGGHGRARSALDRRPGEAFEPRPGEAYDGRAAGGADGRGAGPRTAVPRPPHGNLRARLTSFVGRETEISDILRDLESARLVTLTGPGGSGKTRLSEEAAGTVTADYPDGVWIAGLAPLDQPSAVPGAVLSAVGRRETTLLASGLEGRAAGTDGVDPTSRLVEYCADRRLLLLLDNCEHVIDTAARLTETLLEHCPGVTVLATSREPLGVPGEIVRPVEPLPPAPAHQLFAERAATVRPGFDPAADPDTAAAVAEICRRLDGLPLAIELAAARLRLLTPRQIADRLDDRFRLLTSGSRTALPRQQTLRAVVDWSWDLLDERERTVLRRASVFAGGWTLSAAEAVCADAQPVENVLTDDGEVHGALTDATAGTPRPPAPDAVARAETRSPLRFHARPGARITPAEVLELLGALVDKSLLVVDHPSRGTAAESAGTAGREPRYRMLETIHDYVSERATEGPAARADHKAAVARHTAHFRDFVRTAEPRLRSAGQLPWLRLVEADLDNIRAVLHRSLTTADEDTFFALIHSMGWFWWLRNYRDEGAAWIGRALALEDRPDHGLEETPDGDHPFERFPRIPARVPDGVDGVDEEVTRYWHFMDLRMLLFFLLAEQGSGPDLSDPGIRDAALRMRDAYAGNPGPRSARFPGLLWPFAAFAVEGFAGVLPLMDQTVAGCRKHGDDWAVGVTLMYRTHLAIDMPGGIESVDDDLAELRELTARVGDRWMLAQVEGARGEIAAHRGRFAEARAAYEKARRLAQELGAHTEVPFLFTRLADLALHEKDVAGAIGLVERSEQEAERRGTQDTRAFNQVLRSLVELVRGDLAQARARCDAARDFALRGTPPPQFWVVINGLDGRITGLEGDLAGGVRKLRNTLRDGLEAGSMELLLAHQAESAAELLARCGQERLAARLVGAADGWRGRLPRSPLVAEDVGTTVARLSEALGHDAVEKLRTENTTLTPEQAIRLLDEVLTSLDATDATPAQAEAVTWDETAGRAGAADPEADPDAD